MRSAKNPLMGHVPPEEYAKNREKHVYVRMLRKLLLCLTSFADARKGGIRSIADVGSYNIDMISPLGVPSKTSIDLLRPLEAEGIHPVQADWLDYDPAARYDMICCFQVLEHVEKAEDFARKLLSQATRIVIVSVPYEWPAGSCDEHIHDPVDENKLRQWMGREYDWAFRTVEPDAGVHAERLTAVYYQDRDEAGTDLLRVLEGIDSDLLEARRETIEQQRCLIVEHREIAAALRTDAARSREEAARAREESEELRKGLHQLRKQDLLQTQKLHELEARRVKELQELESVKAAEIEDVKTLLSGKLQDVESRKAQELETLEAQKSEELRILATRAAEELEAQKTLHAQALKAQETTKSAELAELGRRKTLMIDALKNDVVSLKQKTADLQACLDEQHDSAVALQEKLNEQTQQTANFQTLLNDQKERIPYLEEKLAWNRGEVARLRKSAEADQQTILTLDAKARSLAMSMHAREECLPRWLRPFLPKWALPKIEDPIKLKTQTPAPKAAAASVAKQPAPPPPAAPKVATAAPAPANRCPGSFTRYPDRTGRRQAEGGRRLHGEARASRPGEPLVTIITTVKNGEKHLEQAMRSVFTQTCKNIEYIIIDAASTDATLDIIRKHEDKIDYYVSEPDTGIYAGMNKGVELATGDYILILNADDWYVPEAVEKLVRRAESTRADLTAADSRNVDESGRDVPPSPVSGLSRSSWTPMAYIACPLKHEITLVHKNVYARHGLYDENLHICADWKWMAGIYDSGRCKVELLRERLLVFRRCGASSNLNAGSASRHWQERRDTAGVFFPEVARKDLSSVLRMDIDAAHPETQRLKAKYPANEKLHRALDARYHGWRFATRTSEENFHPLQPPVASGTRKVEGGRRLHGETRASRPGEPLVTIVTTVKNGGKHLEQAMQSVFSQTYRNIEYIIIDAASADGTLGLIRQHEDRIDYYVSEPDSGIYAGMNKGIQLAGGDYILILNADDFLSTPDSIAKLVHSARAGQYEIVAGAVEFVDEDGQNHVRTVTPVLDARLFLRCTISHNGMLVHKSVFSRFGLYDESYKVIADWVWMRQCLQQTRNLFLDDAIVCFRSNGLSSRDTVGTAQEKYDVLRREIAGLTWEDYYPMRYPHNLQRGSALNLMEKYAHCREFCESMRLFLEYDIQA